MRVEKFGMGVTYTTKKFDSRTGAPGNSAQNPISTDFLPVLMKCTCKEICPKVFQFFAQLLHRVYLHLAEEEVRLEHLRGQGDGGGGGLGRVGRVVPRLAGPSFSSCRLALPMNAVGE